MTNSLNIGTIDSAALGTDTISSLLYDSAADSLFLLFETAAGGCRLIRYDNASGTPVQTYNVTGDIAPPSQKSGLQRSDISNGELAWGSGTDFVLVDLSTGEFTVWLDSLSGTISPDTQVFDGRQRGLYTFIGTTPTLILVGRIVPAEYSSLTKLSDVITDICTKTGMESDEFDVTNLPDDLLVAGYIIGRPSTGRAALEKLLLAYFVDGIETDFTIKFLERSTTATRTIAERDFGTISSPTGDVSFIESRKPEYDLPAEMSIVFQDPNRDYQQGSAHYQRVSQPTPSMYSKKSENLEVPLVMDESVARDLVQRLLYLTWLSRDESKTRLSWSHIDLDPGDVVEYSFDSGRTLTDRLSKVAVGANFELELDSVRSGDPVYTSAELNPLNTSGVPANVITVPVASNLFVLDIPLIEDFHDISRTASRFYTVVGGANINWRAASLFQSPDNVSYTNFGQAAVDATWGEVQDVLGVPRVVGALDTSLSLTVRLNVDNGDVTSTTFAELVEDPTLNRALVWNPVTGIGEIIQFELVTTNADGTITLDNIVRGLRGTDYAVNYHVNGELFVMLTEQATDTHVNTLSTIGSTRYYKAVSSGTLIGSAPSVTRTWVGRDLRPYAPSQVNRAVSGSDVVVTWNRRTRLGGEWNMTTNIEDVPLNEDSESYTFWLLPNSATAVNDFDVTDPNTYHRVNTLGSPEITVPESDLIAAGYSSHTTETIYVAVCQNSAQVGYGFIASGGLNP